MNIHPSIVSFFKMVWEIIFLAAVTYGTVTLFLITSMTHGRYATIGNPRWDPMLGLAGAYAPFLLWALYVFAHRGWKKVFAFIALIVATFILLLALPHFQHHHSPPEPVMPETG